MCLAPAERPATAPQRAALGKAWRLPKDAFALGDLLGAKAAAGEEAMVRTARKLAGLAWGSLSPRERAQKLREVVGLLRKAAPRVADAVQPTLERAAHEAIRRTRRAVRAEQGIAVTADSSPRDRRVARRLPELQLLFVRDDVGRRADELGDRARSIVARGLEEGLGRKDIADELETAALGLRAPSYWDVVAGSFMSTARSVTELGAYADAGIRTYEVLAVLDEHTTPYCAWINGTQFSVSDSLRRWDASEASGDPFALKSAFPWVRSSNSEFWIRRGDERLTVAKLDEGGRADRAASSERLAELGLSMPPYHGLCRSFVLPVA